MLAALAAPGVWMVVKTWAIWRSIVEVGESPGNKIQLVVVRRIENAISAADRGQAILERVPGEREPGSKVIRVGWHGIGSIIQFVTYPQVERQVRRQFPAILDIPRKKRNRRTDPRGSPKPWMIGLRQPQVKCLQAVDRG